ncbi:hypothetical protein [Pleionea litopenaei]|uniref:Uncharacterized protein n=1 Tax=Pleionea litopenaei TaxID=3070815 RepID=A0AA51RWJ5_9GAMM|nr:hypothetical protein [Pleionea sp. HL-JVS1]WMS88753.1 hypothetical protein Q9312_07500 [Pleionea sp. HL-JVS1]
MELLKQLKEHNGEFVCEEIGAEENLKRVEFRHIFEPPKNNIEIIDITGLNEFYALTGSLTLYYCEESREAAFYIAHPEQWEALADGFSDWVDMLDEDEEEDALPSWFGTHKVIGEIPASGNYILVPTEGVEEGAIYEFEHDGFEFIKIGSSIFDFIYKALDPDETLLMEMASHLRFVSDSSTQQWWITELRHHHGKVVKHEN